MRTVHRGALLTALLLSLGLPPAYADSQPAPPPEPAGGAQQQTLAVTGEILLDAGNYYIRGQTPAEVFRIINPNPAVLDGIIRAGRPVKLQVRSVVGDNVTVESIDGTPYAAP